MDLNSALASATLTKPKKERVINPKLTGQKETPPWWSEEDQRQWAQTPHTPPLDIRGRPLVQPMTPRGEDRPLKDFLGKEAHKLVVIQIGF